MGFDKVELLVFIKLLKITVAVIILEFMHFFIVWCIFPLPGMYARRLAGLPSPNGEGMSVVLTETPKFTQNNSLSPISNAIKLRKKLAVIWQPAYSKLT